MSWRICMAGTAAALAMAVEQHSETLTGSSRAEYDAAKPSLLGALSRNFVPSGEKEPALILEASGHAVSVPTFQRCDFYVSLKPLGATLV